LERIKGKLVRAIRIGNIEKFEDEGRFIPMINKEMVTGKDKFI
jgi:hypothetical protein